MKTPLHEPKNKPALPSLSDVYRRLSELQEEFIDLLKHDAVRNAREYDGIVDSIRTHIHHGRVFLLSTDVAHALEEGEAIRGFLDQLHAALSAKDETIGHTL
jgi:hypothetical protein